MSSSSRLTPCFKCQLNNNLTLDSGCFCSCVTKRIFCLWDARGGCSFWCVDTAAAVVWVPQFLRLKFMSWQSIVQCSLKPTCTLPTLLCGEADGDRSGFNWSWQASPSVWWSLSHMYKFVVSGVILATEAREAREKERRETRDESSICGVDNLTHGTVLRRAAAQAF